MPQMSPMNWMGLSMTLYLMINLSKTVTKESMSMNSNKLEKKMKMINKWTW